MIAITRVAGKPHITPRLDAMWHRGIAGTESGVFEFFESFKAEISSNNKIRIRSGIGMLQGRYFAVEPSTYDEVSIGNGTQGEKRIDLIVARWTVDDENNVQDGDWHVIQGTPTTGTPAVPAHTIGDLDAGDLIADMPMFQVELNGVNITAIKKVYKTWALPIAQGGTGKTTAAEAIENLGAKDYVVSTGTSGIWTYEKYKSGWMKAWCRNNVSLTNGFFQLNSPFGNLDGRHVEIYCGGYYAGSSIGALTAYPDQRADSLTGSTITFYVRSVTGEIPAAAVYEIPILLIAK